MDPTPPVSRRRWPHKFRDAFHGIWLGVRGQSSFSVHLACAAAVVAAAGWFRVTLSEWGLLVICITLVLAAELFNSALESLAKAIDREYNPHLADALDIASGAVLLTAAGAATFGLVVFLPRLIELAST